MIVPQVLIVDHESMIRDTLCWLLEDAGYVVQEAPDGLGAVDLMRASATPLVVLLDLKMPNMSGYVLLRLLPGKPEWDTRHAFIVVSAVTSPNWPPDMMSLLQELSINVVPKPFDVEDILTAVAAEVEHLMARAEHDAQ